jgi:hypothetical protein
MRKTILITEAQQRVILCELANKEIDSTIGENDKLVKRIAKQASDQIKFDLSILGTFSLAIGGLMGPLEKFIHGEYPEMSTMEISLLLAGVGFQYMLDNKVPLSKLIQKIKEDGLYDIYQKVLKKSDVLKDSFLSFVDSLGVSVKKTANIMGYTFLIPLIPLIYNMVTNGQFSENDIVEIIKRLSGFVGLNYGGIGLKELLSLMVDRFRKEK